MTDWLEFTTETGGVVIVEVDEDDRGFEPASREAGPGAIARARQKFEEALGDVRDSAERALAVFTEGTLNPDGVEIEFGVKLNAEAGAVIAKTAVEGHLVVKLRWEPGERRRHAADLAAAGPNDADDAAGPAAGADPNDTAGGAAAGG